VVADEQKSVVRQVEHGRAYARSKGWIVADEHVYVDDGISGAEFANRPGFLRLMNALKPRPRFQILVMSEESRLGREMVATMGADWITRQAPQLRIVSDELGAAAHARLERAAEIYTRSTNGERHGRPALGSPSRYLLTNLSVCSCCGGTLYVVTRSNGSTRKRFYGCSNRHERGTCVNKADVPMPDADLVVIEAVLDDILDESIVRDSVDDALALLPAICRTIGLISWNGSCRPSPASIRT